MSIPEVSSRSRLLAFLSRYLKKLDSAIIDILTVNRLTATELSAGDLTVTGGEITLGAAVSWIKDSNDKKRIRVENLGIYFYDSAGADAGLAELLVADGFCYVYGDLYVAGADIKNSAGLTAITMNSDGSITTPFQPCVAAHLHSDQSITDGLYHPVLFDDDGTLDFDVGLDYDPGTGEFTAPADGKYLFMTNIWFGDVPSNTILVVGLRTTQSVAVGYTLYSYEYLGGTSATWTAASFNTNPVPHYLVSGHWIADMNAGEIGYIEARSTTTVAGTGTHLYGTTAGYYSTLYVYKLA